MSLSTITRRKFLTGAGVFAGVGFAGAGLRSQEVAALQQGKQSGADYTLHIKTSPIEIAPKRIISATTYNGQFPGPLLRFKEGRQVTVDLQ